MNSKTPLKVAVIGGGASGWSAAEALRDPQWEGKFDVTVYEKNDYFGGKCRTAFSDGTTCNGQSGGYELGAGVFPQGAKLTEDLEKLINRHKIPYSNAKEKQRNRFAFYTGGQKVGPLYVIGKIARHPLGFLRVIFDLMKYLFQLRRHSQKDQFEFQGRSKELNKTLSEVFSREFNLFCGLGTQSFGYVHLSDNLLSSPLVYYHQYAPADVMMSELHTCDIGMQGIWATIAASYPSDKALLNTEILSVKRKEDGVYLETSTETVHYDHLIVAVPFGPNLKFMDFSQDETAMLEKIKTVHYVTVLCRAKGFKDIGNFNVDACIDPSTLGDAMLIYKRYVDSDWITINLIYDPKTNKSNDEILDHIETSLRESYSSEMLERSAAKVFHWHDYYPHLETADLNDGWYDKFEQNIQGKKRTLFVSSGLHMETVGASVQYATKKTNQMARQWLKDS